MSGDSLRRRVYDANLELVTRGLVLYTWGNVSGIDRDRGLVHIKPRGIEYDEMDEDDIVTTDLEGTVVEGALKPSVDLDIHLAIYLAFDSVQAIAHTHSTYATAWAQSGLPLPALGTTHGDHFYGDIPLTRAIGASETGPAYERNIGKTVQEAFDGLDPAAICAVLVRDHGPFTWGDSPEMAVENSVILEETARMACLTMLINPQAERLPGHLLDTHYKRKWGPDAYFYQEKA